MSVEKQTIKYKKENVLKKKIKTIHMKYPHIILSQKYYILYYLYIHFSKNLFLQNNSTIDFNYWASLYLLVFFETTYSIAFCCD